MPRVGRRRGPSPETRPSPPLTRKKAIITADRPFSTSPNSGRGKGPRRGIRAVASERLTLVSWEGRGSRTCRSVRDLGKGACDATRTDLASAAHRSPHHEPRHTQNREGSMRKVLLPVAALPLCAAPARAQQAIAQAEP